jgi:hypothetical protein
MMRGHDNAAAAFGDQLVANARRNRQTPFGIHGDGITA